jgi:DNA-binding response OmpR family regulator
VYALTAEDAPSAVEPLRVALMTLVSSAAAQAVVNDLRRDSVQVDLVTHEVLQAAPSASVYIVSLDPVLAPMVADKLVAWAAASASRPGLLALVNDGDHATRELLLAAGFDDSVSTPASSREIAARLRALHRRVHWKAPASGRLRYGHVTLDVYERNLWIDGTSVPLTSIELAVVRELIKAKGRPLSRTQLLDAAWGEGELETSERAVDNVILRLRRKLPRPDLVETVRGVGFRLQSP